MLGADSGSASRHGGGGGGGASPTAPSTSTAAAIRETLERLRAEDLAAQAAERARRRVQRDETRARVRVAQLEGLDRARLAAHAERARSRSAAAALSEQLRACEDRYQADKKRLAGVQDKKARHEAVQRAKAERDRVVGCVRESLRQLGTGGDGGAGVRLPRIASADGERRGPKAAAKANFRAVMEEIRSVKRARSEMLDPYAAELKLGQLWLSINEPERSLECYERAALALSQKHMDEIPPDSVEDVLEKQRRRQREALRFLFTRQLRLDRGADAVDLMTRYLELSLPTERAATIAQLERILRKQPYVEDSRLSAPEDVTRSILSSGSLGVLNDLRFRLLSEMLAASPTDPYLLEAVANMHVRRREFPRARELSAQLGALPAAQRLSLFASFSQFRSQDL